MCVVDGVSFLYIYYSTTIHYYYYYYYYYYNIMLLFLLSSLIIIIIYYIISLYYYYYHHHLFSRSRLSPCCCCCPSLLLPRPMPPLTPMMLNSGEQARCAIDALNVLQPLPALVHWAVRYKQFLSICLIVQSK